MKPAEVGGESEKDECAVGNKRSGEICFAQDFSDIGKGMKEGFDKK